VAEGARVDHLCQVAVGVEAAAAGDRRP
jgi:hypothetical protein